MDDRSRVVSSVTIRNGRFAEIGHGGDTEHAHVIDLRGHTVVPA
jgi:predicted amidohydrolase YtcJ